MIAISCGRISCALARSIALLPVPGCPAAHSRPYSACSVGRIFSRLTGFHLAGKCSDEENPIPADALPGAMAVGRRLPDRRLCALFALSRDRVLERGAGMRCRSADHDVQDPPVGDLPV